MTTWRKWAEGFAGLLNTHTLILTNITICRHGSENPIKQFCYFSVPPPSKWSSAFFMSCVSPTVSSIDEEASLVWWQVSEPISKCGIRPSAVLHWLPFCSKCPKAKKGSHLSFFISLSNVSAEVQQQKAAGERPDSRSERWRRILSVLCLVFTAYMKSSES